MPTPFAGITTARTTVQVQGGSFDVEITSTTDVPGGIVALARAWLTGGAQIGFGEDGSVDLERFRIYNPAAYVPDGTTHVEVIRGENVDMPNFIEDYEAALLFTVADAIRIKAQTFGPENIIPGKVGSTTDTYYSGTAAADDAMPYRSVATEGFATIRGGAGTGVDDTSANFIALEALGTSNPNFSSLKRGIVTFDSSALPDSDTVSSAVLSLYGNTFKANAFGGTADAHICASAPTDPAAIVAGDYANVSRTSFGSIAYGSLSTGAYNDFTLNASGIAAVSKTGVSKFSVQTYWDQANNFDGTWTNGEMYWYWKASETTGTTQDPKLVVEHASSMSASRRMINVS